MRICLIAAVLLAGCDPALLPRDGGAATADARVVDAAQPDGRTPDAADTPDAEVPPALDAAPPDGAVPDAGPLADADTPPDAVPPDAVLPDAAPLDAAQVEGPAVYPADRLVSPLTPFQVARLREVVAARPDRDDHELAKVGASATASTSFLHCFSGPGVVLGGRDALAATIAWLAVGVPDPFTRESLAAVPGRSAGWAIAGDPAPVDQELAALNPRFAAVMYGTNDLQLRDIDAYADHLLTLADHLLAEGVIPVFSSIMPRDDDAEADARVPAYNAVVRGVAQGRQVPFVDLHQALVALPDHGIGPDGIHPTTYRIGGANRACDFSEAGLAAGYNWRNLLTISALNGLVESVLGDAVAPDPPAPARPETGGPNDPIRITALPFTDLGTTATSPDQRLAAYPGCNAAQDESGPERIYRLDLAAPTVVQAYVLDRGDVDIDLHLLADPTDPQSCLQRAHRELTASLAAGTWYFVLDSFVSGGRAHAGEYLFVLLAE